MTDTYEHLVCEICYSAIGRFEPAELHQPLTGAMFTSIRPRREVPPPFAPSLDWEHMRCPMCNHRPFLRRDQVMIAHPACFESHGRGPSYVTVPEAPAAQPAQTAPPEQTAKTAKSAAQPVAQPADAAQASTSQASMAEPDSEESNGPVTCPSCGKQYSSAASLARYHTPCPQATAADEGNL